MLSDGNQQARKLPWRLCASAGCAQNPHPMRDRLKRGGAGSRGGLRFRWMASGSLPIPAAQVCATPLPTPPGMGSHKAFTCGFLECVRSVNLLCLYVGANGVTAASSSSGCSETRLSQLCSGCVAHKLASIHDWSTHKNVTEPCIFRHPSTCVFYM